MMDSLEELKRYLSFAVRLCEHFQKKDKKKTDQFKPIIKETDINDKLVLSIDGTPYWIDGVHISHRYMPEEYFDVTIKYNNDELQKKFMSQMEATSDRGICKSDIVFRNVLLDDSDGKHLFDYFNVIVTSIDLDEQEISALLYMDYWKIHSNSESKYEKQLFDDLMLTNEELACASKAQLEERGWYAECDD